MARHTKKRLILRFFIKADEKHRNAAAWACADGHDATAARMNTYATPCESAQANG
jgi:hypothetical protein